jgi:anaerobic magnesium-protoporphyrin IX monomethyl ester cyclase
MNTVLFANSYFYRLDKKQWKFKQPYPPLATILAAAVLRERGFPVKLFDSNLRQSPSEIIPYLEQTKPDYFVLYDDGFNYLSKMCLTLMREAAFFMIKEAKRKGCTVVVSSSDATDHASSYLEAGADIIIRGEAEETLLELIVCLTKELDWTGVSGITYKEGSVMQSVPSRPVLRDLDSLPLPAWDLVDISSYRHIWVKHHGYFSLNIATTRGCPYKCNWCAKPIYGNRYNSRSPEHVADEVAFLLNNYKPDHFWMCDDIFGLKPGWIQSFAQVVRDRKLQFKYKIQSRVDLLLESDTIQALADSGAQMVWVGAESGSQKILDAMDKGITVKQIHDATHLLRKHNIQVAFFLQLGYLGETKADIQKTIEMLLQLMPDDAGISVSYPLPGTKFYEKVKHQLKEKQNWTNSDDLAMMFQSTFNTQHYRNLHRYVHSLYRGKKSRLTMGKQIRNPRKINSSILKAIAGSIYFPLQAMLLKRKLAGSWTEIPDKEPVEIAL